MNKAVIVSAIRVMILPDPHVTYVIFLRLHNEGLFIHPAAFILLTQRKQTLDESGSREAVVGGGERQLGVSLPSPRPHRLKPPSKKKKNSRHYGLVSGEAEGPDLRDQGSSRRQPH